MSPDAPKWNPVLIHHPYSSHTRMTHATGVTFRIFLVNDCRVAPVPGEIHPGPMHDDDTFVRGSAPEIDVFEATPSHGNDQWALFNPGYGRFDATESFIVPDPTITELNSYTGG